MSHPTSLRLASSLVALQGAALLVAALGFGLAGVAGRPDDRVLTVVEAGMVLAVAAGVLAIADGLRRSRRWSRGPAVTVQLLCLPAGVGLAQNRVWLLAAVVLVLAVAVLAALATPSARSAFEPETTQA